ncbi:hypothetical protein C1141_20565 [Vibrio agarivorans]|nr:hypothetical protein C1141_20565 [Vibrio agarivorans]
MDIAELKKAGGILPPEPVKKNGAWKGNTFDYWVVRPGYGQFERMLREDKTIKGESYTSQMAQMIALCVRLGKKAEEQLTYEQAFCLDPALARVFIEGINEVNGISADPKT